MGEGTCITTSSIQVGYAPRAKEPDDFFRHRLRRRVTDDQHASRPEWFHFGGDGRQLPGAEQDP